MTGFRIEPLSPKFDRLPFNSGSVPLDLYLRELATQDMKRRISNCFVALDDAGTIVEFYSFAATSLPLTELTPEETKRLPRYGVLPAGIIGRLAVDRRYQGRGLGVSLIMDAANRAAHAEPAIFALLVDAKDDVAAAFYKHLGFRAFASRPSSLFLPIASILAALEANTH